MTGLRRLGGLPHLAGHGSQRPGVHPAAGGGGITKREREFAEMEARDAGKPIAETRGFDIRFSAYAFKYFAGISQEVRREVIPMKNGVARGLFDFTTYEPYGVAAVIRPFNYPLHLLTRSLAPALEAGDPAGVVDIISGAGPVCGEALASDEDVDVIAFTGSEEVEGA